jgi:hypothetical protein
MRFVVDSCIWTTTHIILQFIILQNDLTILFATTSWNVGLSAMVA